MLRPVCQARTIGLLAALSLLHACAPRAAPEPPAPPPPPPPKILYEEEVRPLERPQILITNVDEQVSADRKTATVTGTLINRGTGATREVTITVSALDKNGDEVAQHDAIPSTQRIAAGSTATFTSTFDRRPEIDHYHVEAISR